MLRSQASEIMRACSHQCFKRSPCPVPAAVWVLLGKLAMACKLGTPSPPQPALFHSLSLPKPSPWRVTWMWHAGRPLPPCRLHASTPLGSESGLCLLLHGMRWGCYAPPCLELCPRVSGPAVFISLHPVAPLPGTLGLWVGLGQSWE